MKVQPSKLNKVAVVVPVYKAAINKCEEISLKQGFSILRNYPFVLVCPETLDISVYDAIAKEQRASLLVERFSPDYFSGLTAYNGLMLSRSFYQRFPDYRYLLIYQTDAYVFRDELAYWCDLGYDYIGAPIFRGGYDAKPDATFLGVGNGGFSLRNVQSHLRALQTFTYFYSQAIFLKQLVKRPSFRSLKASFLNFVGKNNQLHRFNQYPINEDDFWGYRVPKYCKWFNVPDMNTALKFSIEVLPERFIVSETDLPFGCHAWPKYRQEFWRKYISQ